MLITSPCSTSFFSVCLNLSQSLKEMGHQVLLQQQSLLRAQPQEFIVLRVLKIGVLWIIAAGSGVRLELEVAV